MLLAAEVTETVYLITLMGDEGHPDGSARHREFVQHDQVFL